MDGHGPILVKPIGEMADVHAERDRINTIDDLSNTPIVVRDIQKVYPGQDGGNPKVWMDVNLCMDHRSAS